MRKWIIAIIVFASACFNSKPNSFFRFEKIEITPVKQIEKGAFFLNSYTDSFVSGSDVKMVFSTKELQFVNAKGDMIVQYLPYAGNLGTYKEIKEFQIKISNSKYPDFQNITGELTFDSYASKGARFLLSTDEVISFGKNYDGSAKLMGGKTLGDFNNFMRLVNSRDSLTLNRDLIRRNIFIYPYVVFNIPGSYCTLGENNIKLIMVLDDYSVYTEKTVLISNKP